MRCKIVRTQKLLWRNIMRSTKSQKASVLYYSIDNRFQVFFQLKKKKNTELILILVRILPNKIMGACLDLNQTK